MTPVLEPEFPVDEAIPALIAAIRCHRGAVLMAPPGAGKTTRVPLALLPLIPAGEIVVLEPRRLAARLAAEHVARGIGEAVGERVGYSVRFDERRSPRTRVRYATTGVLVRTLTANPTLRGIAALLFDEFHERHGIDDVLLAWAHRLRATTRPDLVVIVMSATLATGAIARFLGVPEVVSQGRAWPVEVVFAARPDSRPLSTQIADAVEAEANRPDSGDLLVFLPGLRAIERCQTALATVAERYRLEPLQLHASLPEAAMRDALKRRTGGIRRVLLSTNVAESSVTLDGVGTVIDSGLHNVARSNPWTGLSALVEETIPKDSATQRAGRAGRQGPGRAIRLYTRDDFDRRPGALDPEIHRDDLTELVLSLAGLGVHATDDLAWLDPPEDAAFQRAREVLRLLGGVDDAGVLTPDGRRLLELPVHPRLGRLVLEANARGAGELGAWAAAVLSEDVRLRDGQEDTDSDVLALVSLARSGRDIPRALKSRIETTARDVARSQGRGGRALPSWDGDDAKLAVREALLHAFPDRVARRREGEPKRLMLVDGGSAEMALNSTVRHGTWLLAVDATGGVRCTVRVASAFEPDWLLGLPGAEADLTETLDVRWNDRSERVEAFETTRYRGLPLERRAVDPRGRPEASKRLREEVRSTGLGRFTDADALERHLARRAVAALGDPAITAFGPPELEALLDDLCATAVSFKEVKEADLLSRVEGTIPWPARQRIDTLAPERMPLPSGRSALVRYPPGGAPRLSAQVQHLFGLLETPRIANGRVKLLIELLAPNQRPVQLTDDLAGFWQRTWLEVRKELRGRYPKHRWPEDPHRPDER